MTIRLLPVLTLPLLSACMMHGPKVSQADAPHHCQTPYGQFHGQPGDATLTFQPSASQEAISLPDAVYLSVSRTGAPALGVWSWQQDGAHYELRVDGYRSALARHQWHQGQLFTDPEPGKAHCLLSP
ncbi:hypothetical protein [Ferrimonas balearica]|uniref:hypothetical protein n=1 Tax=Ferrimonas balearica TaxID=44012 RepID=UPI001C99AA69|nr:hypothetical protein [Ferrimonas balearica]MBY5991201.1 hypothetical protein [Ferrimonas balearica]